MSDAPALENEVTPAEAGQSQASEVTQAATPAAPSAFDPEQFKNDVLEAARKVAATQAEQERRRIQGQADAKIAEISRMTQAQIEATRKAMLDALKEQVGDEEVLARVEQTLPIRQKATLYDLTQHEQEQRAMALRLEQQAVAMAQGLGLKREDFSDEEWGGGMPIDQWYQAVAVPKAIAKAKAEAVNAKVAAVQAERKEVTEKASAGVTATELAGGTLPERKPKRTLEDAGDLGDLLRQKYKLPH